VRPSELDRLTSLLASRRGVRFSKLHAVPNGGAQPRSGIDACVRMIFRLPRAVGGRYFARSPA
jgi:hypothetical protein